MTIEDHDIIDGMGVDAQTREAVLLISDHLTWDDQPGHFARLELKLQTYVHYVESGQLLKALPSARGLLVRVRLVHRHAPPASAAKVLADVGRQLGGVGIAFSYEGLPFDY